jgi:hypothetical protein
MLLFIPRSLCALKRVAAKSEHARFGATTGIRIALAGGLYRAEATDGHRAMVVQGLVPIEDPPWPGFKDLPDDACGARQRRTRRPVPRIHSQSRVLIRFGRGVAGRPGLSLVTDAPGTDVWIFPAVLGPRRR